MGGSSKKTTVGYKYFLGMHMVLCHGPVDKITRIRVGGKTVWVGNRRSGRINIDKPTIFGGESREGGVSGAVDFEPGEPTQGLNDYLSSNLGSLVPNFRGVVGIVLRQVYLSMNPYLKAWDFRVSRILTRSGGLPQWYPVAASIPTGESFVVRQRILLCIDDSGSMNDSVGSQTRLDVVKSNIINVLDQVDILAGESDVPVDIAIDLMNGGGLQKLNASSSDISSLKSYVIGISASGGTDFTSHFAYAKTYFSAHTGERNNVMVMVTDGVPSPVENFPGARLEAEPILKRQSTWSGNNEVEVYAINIDLGNTDFSRQLDNTEGDGVPVIDGSSSTALFNAVFFAFMGSSPAMNIIHAIRECITDVIWGMGYSESEIDDRSFRKAADTLRSERLGVCLIWDRQKPIEDMVQELLKHADAALYVDRRTGLFTIKLIRDDYDPATLIHLTEENIVKVDDFNRPGFGELTTSVTVNYWNVNTGETGSVIAEDIALANMQQANIPTTLQYPGLPDPITAAKVAQRELKALSNQFVSFTLETDRIAKDLVVGDVVKVSWPDYGIEEIIVRVVGIGYGDGKNNRIKLSVVEDVFGTPSFSYIAPSEPQWEDPAQPPTPIVRQLAFEVPYLELVQRQGAAIIDEVLLNNSDAGFVGASGANPGGSILNSRLYINNGVGYEDVAMTDFTPVADLLEAVNQIETIFELSNIQDLDQVVLGTWAQIGDELIAVVSLDNELLTVKRGVLDTVPTTHAVGDTIFFWDDYSVIDTTEYVTSEEVLLKLAPVSGSGELPLSEATEMQITVRGRAYKPFRPANLKVDGENFPDVNLYPDYPVTITWLHRNRLQETGGSLVGYYEASMDPEEGTTYKVVVEALEADQTTVVAVAYTESGIIGETFTLDPSVLGEYASEPFIKTSVYSERDGVDSWQAGSLIFRGPFQEPYNLIAVYRERSAPTGLASSRTINIKPLNLRAFINEL